VCCNYNLNTLTDVPYQMTVGGAFVCAVKTRSFVITRFFPVDPHNRVIMELQCTTLYT